MWVCALGFLRVGYCFWFFFEDVCCQFEAGFGFSFLRPVPFACRHECPTDGPEEEEGEEKKDDDGAAAHSRVFTFSGVLGLCGEVGVRGYCVL